ARKDPRVDFTVTPDSKRIEAADRNSSEEQDEGGTDPRDAGRSRRRNCVSSSTSGPRLGKRVTRWATDRSSAWSARCRRRRRPPRPRNPIMGKRRTGAPCIRECYSKGNSQVIARLVSSWPFRETFIRYRPLCGWYLTRSVMFKSNVSKTLPLVMHQRLL